MRRSEMLHDFVKTCTEKGHGRAEIAAALEEAGWKASEAEKALAGWRETSLGLLAPGPGSTVSARDFLFYAVLFGALLLTGIYIILAMLLGIDLMFEEETRRWRPDLMRFYIAVLIVVTPVYVWLQRLDMRAGQERSGIRRWMVSVVLLIAALTFLGDLVWVIYGLLKGDLALQTLLKMAVVAAVSGGAFVFYRTELQEAD